MDNQIKVESKKDQEKIDKLMACKSQFSDFLNKLDTFKDRSELYKQYVKINGCIETHTDVTKINEPTLKKYNNAIEITGKKFFVVKTILKNINDSDFSALTASGVAYHTVESAEADAWAGVGQSKSSIFGNIVPNFSFGTVMFILLLILALYNKSQKRDKIQEIAYITDMVNDFNKKIKEKNNKKNDI
jgi:hypothetical protein